MSRNRNSTYIPGVGDKPADPSATGTYIFDKKLRKFVKVSDKAPNLAGRLQILGEPVICAPGGEMMDLDPGKPTYVADTSEKIRYLRERKAAPAPKDWKAEGPKKKAKRSFAEFFKERNGYSLDEHVSRKYGPEAQVNLEIE